MIYKDPMMTGKTPLVCAIESGLTQPVLALLDAGALINEPTNEYGWTALHAALAFPQDNVLEVVELLMARGGDPYIKIYNGENAFDIANRWGENLELQDLLHDTHFNEAIQMRDVDTTGNTPLICAIQDDSIESVAILNDRSTIALDEVLIMDSNPQDQVMLHNTVGFSEIQPMNLMLHFELNIPESL